MTSDFQELSTFHFDLVMNWWNGLDTAEPVGRISSGIRSCQSTARVPSPCQQTAAMEAGKPGLPFQVGNHYYWPSKAWQQKPKLTENPDPQGWLGSHQWVFMLNYCNMLMACLWQCTPMQHPLHQCQSQFLYRPSIVKLMLRATIYTIHKYYSMPTNIWVFQSFGSWQKSACSFPVIEVASLQFVSPDVEGDFTPWWISPHTMERAMPWAVSIVILHFPI